MFLLGVLVMSTDSISISSGTGERVKANGAVTLAIQASILSLFSLFFGAVFVVTGVMRDQTHKALEMIHSTPVPTRNMTLSRMIGVYIATFLCIFAAIVGLFAGQFAPWVDKESLGPIKLSYFLQPTILYVAVNTLLICGLFTAIAAVTRNRALVYVSAVGLFILYTMSGLFVGEDGPDLLVSMVDPFGANALAITTEFWPADEQNTRLSPLGGYIGINRLVWGGAGLALLLGVFRLFKRGLVTRKTKLFDETELATTGRIELESAQTNLGFANSFSSFWTRLKFEYLTMVKSVPFIILSLIALSLFIMVLWFQMEFVPDPTLPTNLQTVRGVLGSTRIPILIILTFFSGEIIWRDKTAGITEILDASPVQNWPLMAGKWLALMGVVLTIILLAIVVGMCTQIVMGDVAINPGTYFKYAFIDFAPEFLLYAALVLFIQNFMPNRVVGMIAAGAVVIFLFFFVSSLPFYHPLMGFGNVPTGGISEMNGFADLKYFKWFGLYWGALAALMAVLSIWLWRRGLQAGLIARLRGFGKRVKLPSMAVAAVCLAGFGFTGVTIHQAFEDSNYRTRKQGEKRLVKREELFAEHFKKPVPKIRSVEVDISMQPEKQIATIKGKYIIENTTGEPLELLFVHPASRHKEDVRSLTVAGAERVTEFENLKEIESFIYQIHRFDPPLPVGAKTEMSFETFFHEPRLRDGSRIRKNGTFINNFDTLPGIEIEDRRMQNPDTRQARNFNFFSRTADYVDFKAKFCTDKGQVLIAPGKLMREYEENGQACRDYQSINPILNFFAFISGEYAVKQDVWNNPNGEDVDLAIYYHAQHDYNVDLMIEAMKSSLDTFTTSFGPYQYNQVRIMEFPYASFAQAFAGTIPFSENIGFVLDPGDPDDNESLDLASYVTMHEIGHQWFAHQIVPANTKGFNILSEGLTENAAMTAYEKKFGWQKARRVLERRSVQTYLMNRAADRDDEPALAEAANQRYLIYNKASWVFWGLRHYVGADKINGAIKGFVDEYGSKGPLYPTTKEMIEALRAASPEDMQGLITDYWDRITFWDLKFGEDINVQSNSSGGYTVELTAIVDKLIATEETGKETSVTEIEGEDLDEWVEIGLYAEDPKKTLGDEWLLLERVRLKQPETKLSFDLKERPAFISIDPRRLLIERNDKDNTKPVKLEKLAASK